MAKQTPLKARNKYVAEVMLRSGAGAHGKTTRALRKSDRQKLNSDLRNGKFDHLSA